MCSSACWWHSLRHKTRPERKTLTEIPLPGPLQAPALSSILRGSMLTRLTPAPAKPKILQTYQNVLLKPYSKRPRLKPMTPAPATQALGARGWRCQASPDSTRPALRLSASAKRLSSSAARSSRSSAWRLRAASSRMLRLSASCQPSWSPTHGTSMTSRSRPSILHRSRRLRCSAPRLLLGHALLPSQQRLRQRWWKEP